MAAMDQLTGLMSALNALQGSETEQKQTTGGGKTTQQTQLSDAAVQEQIRKILAGPGGVREIGGAARRSGLYDSTTEETLLGNLYAQAAVQGETARAPTVTETTPQTVTTKQETPGIGIGPVLGAVAGAAALNKVLDIGGGLIGGGLDSLLGSLGIGGGSKGTTSTAGTGTKGSKNLFDSFGSDLSTDFSMENGDFGLSAAINEGPGISFGGNPFKTQMGLGLPGIGEGKLGASGNVSKQDSSFDLVGSISSALSGVLGGGGGLGGLLGGLTGGFGGGGRGGATTGGSVICTALMEQGELDARLYAAGSKYLEELDPLTKVGYHIWATKVAANIRKGSKVAAAICKPFARSRTSLLASSGTVWDHIKYPLGTITKFVGEPACYAIGYSLVTLALWADLQLPETKGV